MNYPIVFDKFETAFTGYGLAVLENSKNVKIREVINGEYLLTLTLPRNDPKWQHIHPENFISVKGQIFRIRSFDEQRDREGKLLSNIQCEHVWYDANDCKHIPSMELIGVTPLQVLQAAFAGTRFTVGTVEITTPTDIFMSKANPGQVVAKLVENVGGELLKDNWTINLLQRRGSNRGIQFRVGKNIQTIRKATDATKIVTRLYPYGKDSMDISTVNGGTQYIDSPLINNYDRPKIGYIDYKDIEDPAEILAVAQAEFSTSGKDGIDKPRVTYSCEIVELKKLKEYGSAEEFFNGDTVRIVDEGLNTDTLQRIIEYDEYPYEPQKSSVGLANYSVQAYRENTTGGMLAGFVKSSSYVDTVTNEKGQLNPGWFENIKTKLKTLFNGSVKQAVVHSQGDIWVDNPDNPTKAMAILSDGFAIANSKLPNGDWDWKTFGTAEGFVADLITAGVLKAIEIEGCTITGNEINGGTINGSFINGGVIDVDTDIRVGNNVFIGDNSLTSDHKTISFFNNGNGMAEINVLKAGPFYSMFFFAGDVVITGTNSIKLSASSITKNDVEIATINDLNTIYTILESLNGRISALESSPQE